MARLLSLSSTSTIRSRTPVLPWLFALVTVLAGCATPPAPRQEPPAPGPEAPAGRPKAAAPLSAAERLIRAVARAHGPEAAARVRYWFALIEQGKSVPDLERLRLTNNFFNGARFTTDQEVWQQEDYWATPVDFLIVDAGDCEDFAIAKYFTLNRMGIAEDAMRITYVRAVTLRQPHMVLAWYPAPDAEPLILDNIEPRILPASERPDLTPVYSFNGTTLWLARTRREQIPSGDASSLGNWQELRERFAAELQAP